MRRATLEADRDYDVVVVGGGLAGCATALELARRGRRVGVLESGGLANGTGASFGHVRVGLEIPYSEAAGSLGRDGAREVWEAHRENRAWIEQTLGALGQDCAYRVAGGFRLAETRAQGLTLAESEDMLREDGFSGEFLDHYMLEARFDVHGFAGAYWAADDAEIDAARFVGALGAAAERAGAVIHEGSPVLDLDLSARGAEAVTARGRARAPLAVIALGPHAPRLVPFFEGRIAPVEGRRLVFERNPSASLPSPAELRRGRLSWRVLEKGLLVGSLGLPREEAAPPVDVEAFVAERLPGVAGVLLERASGLAAQVADRLPLVGPVPGLPAIAVCGFGTGGLSCAPLAARWAAEVAVTGRNPTPTRFRAARALPGAAV